MLKHFVMLAIVYVDLVQACIAIMPHMQWRNYGMAGGAVAPPAFEEPETVTAALSL